MKDDGNGYFFLPQKAFFYIMAFLNACIILQEVFIFPLTKVSFHDINLKKITSLLRI